MSIELELKIYAFVVFFIVLFFFISYIRYNMSRTNVYFKYYIEDETFGAWALVLSTFLGIVIAIRLVCLLAIWWFNIK